MLRRLAALALLTAAALPGGAEAADRVALLIGNADYAGDAFDLRNPTNDAEALGAALRDLGFDVEVAVDLTGEEMRKALERASARMRSAEIGLVFYAGHGMQIEGRNYLVGSDFGGESREALFRASATLDEIREAIGEAGPSLGVIVLDACRDDPLGAEGRGLADASGLERADITGAGLLVAYATDPGDVAADGVGENSIFTEALLRHVGAPSLDIRLMFGRVRQEVVLATLGRQVPWVQESVVGGFALNPAPPPDAGSEDGADSDLAAWREADRVGSPPAFRRYLEAFPDGLFADLARARLDDLSGPPGSAPPSREEAASVYVAGADPDRLARSLSLLGFLPAGAEVAAADREGLSRGLAAFLDARARQGFATTPSAVHLEAARHIVFTGSRVSQRLRTDMVALAAVERAQGAALDAYRQLADLRGVSDEAERLFEQATDDLVAIEVARRRVLARLDRSRAYYDELLTLAGAHYRSLVETALVADAPGGATRELNPARAEAMRDARLFVRHVRVHDDPRAPGSMAWLADFLPRG